jgi:methionyl-tRNA formyltransferase
MINNSHLGLSSSGIYHLLFGLRRASLRYGRPSLPLTLSLRSATPVHPAAFQRITFFSHHTTRFGQSTFIAVLLHPMRIVFFGTPDFAVASLEALIRDQQEIVAVVTAPDKPAGRGMQLQASPVKQCALTHHIPVWQPEKLKAPEFVAQLQDAQADLFVVVAFRMLPEVVWNMPPLGTINVHGSLLPQYRGAAPIHWAVMNGEKETGVTTFRLQHAIDTGDILLQEKLPIGPTETTGELYERMMHAGAALLVKTLHALQEGSITPQAQNLDVETKHAPKLTKQHGLIDWSKTSFAILNQIRGLAPMPSAYTFLNNKQLKIHQADCAEEGSNLIPGTIKTDHKTYCWVACADAWLNLDEIQLEGKKRMPIADFLRGNTLPESLTQSL